MAIFRALLLSMTLIAILVKLAIGANYMVGGETGWDKGSDYQAWAAAQSFYVGDTLSKLTSPVFTYSTPHNVAEVTNADYESCQTSNVLQLYSSGNTRITLTSPGKRNFICAYLDHCSLGMKLQVDTLATSPPTPISVPPPATSPSTSPKASPPSEPKVVAPAPAIVIAPSKSPKLAPSPSPLHPPSLVPLASVPPVGVPSIHVPSPSASSTPSSPSTSSGNRGHLLSKLTTGIWFGMLILLSLQVM
ncbi:hypothetical protein NE237_002462 [Protea cynaroides]|uniref:Phytocyanin domain-containing protein n=1 Tax=Protea cynaroides TaxID=273540 RepID=A0A9Q0KVY5_9MAGN|nr:hypothetical protein NE237_002462 [Protea cynaroides]